MAAKKNSKELAGKVWSSYSYYHKKEMTKKIM